MNYVRSTFGSVSKTWNSINPATLSGAVDVIVVEHEDGTLACSPFHVRFGKISLLRPYDKKVEFTVNDVKQDFPMKLGEGGEAFFVFETSASIPEDLQTSPLVSPASSPEPRPVEVVTPTQELPEPDLLDITSENRLPSLRRNTTSLNAESILALDSSAKSRFDLPRPVSGDWSGHIPSHFERSVSEDILPSAKHDLTNFNVKTGDKHCASTPGGSVISDSSSARRSTSPPPLSTSDAVTRAINLSKKLWTSNIPTQVTDNGDLMLDMTGYKSSEDDALRAEVVARKIIAEELEGNYDIGALIGADEKGNLWIYSSEEAKEAAARKMTLDGYNPAAMTSSDAISDPGYHSDDARSDASGDTVSGDRLRRDSDSAVGLSSPPKSPDATKNYAKTLRLTSEQLKTLNLRPGANSMSFNVNRAICQANIFLWHYDVPIVISDIDGTITKSDALGHVLNMIGRDWTHLGVAKLYTDIAANGYNIFYLTSRSVGQADSTRAYLKGVIQDGYRLPNGPVIMSPDRTIAALRREIYLRKPEVFKMACLRDIRSLFGKRETPFYAGFGNRFTDALSYRSVSIPSTRIFTINSNAEVSLDVLSLNKYKTGYASMREIVDHFFPPVGLLVKEGGEQFTDFNYWREQPLELDDFTDSESEDNGDGRTFRGSIRSEDERSDVGDEDEPVEDLEASYLTRSSIDEGDLGDSIMESIEGDDIERSIIQEDEGGYEEDDEEYDDDEDATESITQDVDALDLDSETPPAGPRGPTQNDLKNLAQVLNSSPAQAQAQASA
ncbi:LNS2-domain-containing protein [Patellaria atrata CBS 101060]|uniref:LNS2-domain-containing protein n=1 Tax=Patellaria atrata CBS 101060 TaxID=1346257 RepID=A0A9P4SAZ6_9PEZI|nr:LNS2-domain-containing protein [Patellaria atrata CBS 101060]